MAIKNTLKQFINEAENESYIKDIFIYLQDVLSQLGISHDSQLYLVDGDVQDEFPDFPIAFIWILDTRDEKKVVSRGAYYDTEEMISVEIVYKNPADTFSAREKLKVLLSKKDNLRLTTFDEGNMKPILKGTTPNIVGQERYKSVMFFLHFQYIVRDSKSLMELPIRDVDIEAKLKKKN